MPIGRRTTICVAVLGLGACVDPPRGLAPTADGDGPRVVFDFDHLPLPEIPLPNDIATRPDPSSPTGLRINASMDAPTRFERVARRRIDELSGWGGYQQIAVAFDAPLDLEVIYARHRDFARGDGRDYDFANDAVYLIDVTPGSPTYLEPQALDFGEGNFPVLLRTPQQYFEHDPKTITKALTYETHDEDLDGDGELDPGEDLDLDGVLDRPNADDLDGDGELDPVRELISFYERETDTLLFKPVLPLREATTYAVVLTTRLRGRDGEPVRSPFEFVNHATQTDELEPALETLAEYGLDAEDIAFAWTFTTQDATGDMVLVRDGLYGAGPLSWLAEDNPPELSFLYEMLDAEDRAGNRRDNVHILPNEILNDYLEYITMAAFGAQGDEVDVLVRTHDYYAYHVSGRFKSPRLLDLVDEGNLDERAWPADLRDPSLRERVEYDEVQFWCAIPKKEYLEDPTKPAPVVLYAHGYTSNKLEQLGLGLHAKFGIAGCSIDAVGHGLDAGEFERQVRDLFEEIMFAKGAGDALLAGRAEDVDGDGEPDIGAEFFTAYLFRTRDNLRQSLVDWLGLVRLLRTFGSTNMGDMDGDGTPELLGDFDADGVVDLGGPDADFFASGTSLGGLISSALSGIEPRVVAAAPISGGAGLVDLAVRSEQGGMVEAVSLRLMGPLIVGEPDGGGGTRIYTLVPSGNDDARRTLAYRQAIEPGDVVMVTNLDATPPQSRCARVMPETPPPGYGGYVGWRRSTCPGAAQEGLPCRTCGDGEAGTYACDLAGTFRVGIPADKDDRLVIEVFAGPDAVEIEGAERHCTPHDDAKLRTTIDTFEVPVPYWRRSGGERVPETFAPGDELVALEDGFGFQRATPSLRKFSAFGQIIVEGADPAMYAVHYSRDPLVFHEGDEEIVNPPTNVLNVVTVGDANVPVNTGIGIAKVAGFVELFEPDPRHGKTVNRVLIDEGIQEGVPWLEVRGPAWGPVLVDPDNLSGSTNVEPMDPTGSVDGLVAPRLDPPLRIIAPMPGTKDGKTGVVLPMIDEFDGAHGFSPPGMTDLDFDVGQFMEHQIGWFFRSRGTEVRFDPCMATMDECEFIPSPPPEP